MKKLMGFSLMAVVMLVLAACGDDDSELLTISATANIDEAEVMVEPDTLVGVGTEVTLEAPTVEGYAFIHFEDEIDGTVLSEAMSYTFTAEDDVHITAIYEGHIVIDITSALGLDLISISPVPPVSTGTEVTVTADETEGMAFSHWINADTGDVLSETNPYTFIASEAKTIEAVYTESRKQVAEEALANFDDDFGHMETMIDEMEQSDALSFNMTLDLAVMMDNPGVQNIHVDVEQSFITGDVLKARSTITISADMLPGDTMMFDVITIEDGDYYEMYVDMGFFLDMMLEEEEPLDLRTLLDMDSDIIYIYMPETMKDGFDEILGDALKDAFGDEVDEALLNDLQAILISLKNNYDVSYFINLDAYGIEASIDDEHFIITNINLESGSYQTLFNDMFEDVYQILTHLDVEGMMLPYEIFIETKQYEALETMISEMPPFSIQLKHDPVAEDVLQMSFDLMPMFDELDVPMIESVNIDMAWSKEASIEEPSDYANIYHITEELMMIAVLDASYHYLDALKTKASLNDGTYSFEALNDDVEYHRHIPLIDVALSTVIVEGEEIYIDPVYQINGLSLFKEPLNKQALIDAGFDDETGPETRETILEFLAFFDDEHMNIYQNILLIMEMMVEDIEEDLDPTDPTEPQDEYPEGDVVDYPDLMIPRYTDSVMTDALDGDVDQFRVYYTQSMVKTVYDFYYAYFNQQDEWQVIDAGYWDVDDSPFGAFELNHETYTASISIEYVDTRYDSNAKIGIFIESKQDLGEYPGNDLITLNPIDEIKRYEGSVLIDGFDRDDVHTRVYVSDDSLDNIYQGLLNNYQEAAAWTLISHEIDHDEDEAAIMAMIVATGETILIQIVPSEQYQDAYEITIVYTP